MGNEQNAISNVVAADLMHKLAIFAAVAANEHVTNAATSLGVPQPTVSRVLARLEQEMGTALFVRQGRAVRLTPAGRTFASYVTRALDEITAGIEQTLNTVDRERGRVSFGFPLTMGSSTVPHLIRDFHDKYPNITLELTQGDGNSLLNSLRHNHIDLSLISPPPDTPEITSTTIHYQYLRLLVPRGHKLAERRSVRLAEVGEERFIAFPEEYWISSIIRGLFQQSSFEPTIAFRSRESETIRGLVSAGLGVAIMPPTASRWPGITELELAERNAYREIGLVSLRERTLPPPVALFRDFVVARRHQFSGAPTSSPTLSALPR